MTPVRPDWRTADRAYQAHHTSCPTCIAAGAAPGARERCPQGAELWATYQAAGMPPHFAWIAKAERMRKLLESIKNNSNQRFTSKR